MMLWAVYRKIRSTKGENQSTKGSKNHDQILVLDMGQMPMELRAWLADVWTGSLKRSRTRDQIQMAQAPLEVNHV
jgi:hypothetical protein